MHCVVNRLIAYIQTVAHAAEPVDESLPGRQVAEVWIDLADGSGCILLHFLDSLGQRDLCFVANMTFSYRLAQAVRTRLTDNKTRSNQTKHQ